MMIMNENMLNMLKELDSEFSDNYGLREGLRIDAIDLKDRYDDDIDFDEELLDELRIYYKNKTVLIKRYDRDNWVIEDEDYIKFEDFREVGKILSIVMKHLSRIELDWFATILKIESDLELVKGFQVIGDRDVRELQQQKFITKVGVIFPFPLFHTVATK